MCPRSHSSQGLYLIPDLQLLRDKDHCYHRFSMLCNLVDLSTCSKPTEGVGLGADRHVGAVDRGGWEGWGAPRVAMGTSDFPASDVLVFP